MSYKLSQTFYILFYICYQKLTCKNIQFVINYINFDNTIE